MEKERKITEMFQSLTVEQQGIIEKIIIEFMKKNLQSIAVQHIHTNH